MIPTWLLVSVIMTVKSMAWPVSVERVTGWRGQAQFYHVNVKVDAESRMVVCADLPYYAEGAHTPASFIDLPMSSAPTAPTTGCVLYYSYPRPEESPEWPPERIKIPGSMSVFWLNSQTFALVPSGTVVWAAGLHGVVEWPREEEM